MSSNVFVPKVYQGSEKVTGSAVSTKIEKLGGLLLITVRYIVAALFFLVPVVFVPGLPASLGFDKVLVAAAMSGVALVLLCLSALRFTRMKTVLPVAIFAFIGFLAIATVSAGLSGDMQDALRGSVMEPQTVGFFALLGLVMLLPLVLQGQRRLTIRALALFGVAATLILLYTLIRLFFGAETLTLASFSNLTVSPIGSFNDLALFAATTIFIALISLLQLPLRPRIQWGLILLIVIALGVLVVVNFFNLWLVVGFFGLLLLVYSLSRDTLLAKVEGDSTKQTISPLLIGTTVFVCAVAGTFIIAGESLGARISTFTNTNYIEVRPSFTATIDIARAVYQEDVLLGTGPNRFADAWRLHKDTSINETVFWNTPFNAGVGYVPTLFVTTGALGGLLMVVFHILVLRLGYKMLLRNSTQDTFWFYVGTVSFVSAVFLWGMSYVYVPGAAILLLAGLFTGLSFTAYAALVPETVLTIALVNSRRRGFFLMSVVIVVISATTVGLFGLGKQYRAQVLFTEARSTATTPVQFEQQTAAAFAQYQDDIFAGSLAQVSLAEVQQLLTVTNPTEAEQQLFITAAKKAVDAAELAITLDPSNPDGHALLAQIFAVLAQVGFSDAENRAVSKLQDAVWRDPKNPTYPLIGAYLAVQLNDVPQARSRVLEALALKSNYTEALFLLTQLDIKENKLTDAISNTRQLTTLEPNNSTRYYQLGVLLAADKQLEPAVEAYKAALTLDPNFANARYMLALTQVELGDVSTALVELKAVAATNQDNAQLNSLISQLETTGGIASSTPNGTTVTEEAPKTAGDTVTTASDPDTPLVSPVNTVSDVDSQ